MKEPYWIIPFAALLAKLIDWFVKATELALKLGRLCRTGGLQTCHAAVGGVDCHGRGALAASFCWPWEYSLHGFHSPPTLHRNLHSNLSAAPRIRWEDELPTGSESLHESGHPAPLAQSSRKS